MTEGLHMLSAGGLLVFSNYVARRRRAREEEEGKEKEQEGEGFQLIFAAVNIRKPRRSQERYALMHHTIIWIYEYTEYT